jgi:hypothetical protein
MNRNASSKKKNPQPPARKPAAGPAPPNMNKTVTAAVKRALAALPKGTFATIGGGVAGPGGALAGSMLSKITGYGEYEIGEASHAAFGSQSSKHGGVVPQFDNHHDKTVIRHREYVGPVVSPGTGFTNTAYDINPGNSTLFPWLSSIARSYQQYKILGAAFVFKSLTSEYASSGGLGQVIMATNYNVNDDDFSSTIQMENSEYAVAVKPSVSAVHPLECASDVRRNDPFYVYDPNANASGSVTDKRFRDMGKFQIATEGLSTTPGVTIGQLWVTYEVELIKPILPYTAFTSTATPAYWSASSYSQALWTENISANFVSVAGMPTTGGFVVSLSGAVGDEIVLMWKGLGTNIVNQTLSLVDCSSNPSALVMDHEQMQWSTTEFTGHAVIKLDAAFATATVNAPANTAYLSGWLYAYKIS